MDSGLFELELQAHVRRALAVAAESPDVRHQEPSLVRIVRLVEDNPDRRSDAEKVLAGLVPMLCETPPPSGLIELLSYCVHSLGLADVIVSAREHRRVALEELERGESRRPWEHVRRCEQVIEAADPNWEDREMFESLSS